MIHPTHGGRAVAAERNGASEATTPRPAAPGPKRTPS
jgi:hypothetical protein